LAGADRWYEYHEYALARLKLLVNIIDDPNVPEGAQIKLSNDKSFSPFNRALESRKRVVDEKLIEEID
jgi:hypothetical protein